MTSYMLKISIKFSHADDLKLKCSYKHFQGFRFSAFFPFSFLFRMDWIHHRSLCLLKAFSSSQNFIFCWLLMSSLFHLQELTKYYQLLRKVALFLNRVLLVHLSWTGSKHLPCRKIQQCMRDLCHIHPTIIFLTLFFPSEILLQWLKPLLHTVLRIQNCQQTHLKWIVPILNGKVYT